MVEDKREKDKVEAERAGLRLGSGAAEESRLTSEELGKLRAAAEKIGRGRGSLVQSRQAVWVERYGYDGNGNRVTKGTARGTVSYRYDSEDPVRDGVNWFAYVNNDPVNWVDLWGLYGEVTRNGNDITINIPVVFTGDAATSANIQSATKGIENHWSGQFGPYNVTTVVTVLANSDSRIPYNSVNMVDSDGRASVTGYIDIFGIQGFNIGNANATLYPPAGDLEWVAAHEAGHLLGLGDRYKDNAKEESIPDDGWAGNIMASYKGVVEPRNIEQLLQGNTSTIQTENLPTRNSVGNPCTY